MFYKSIRQLLYTFVIHDDSLSAFVQQIENIKIAKYETGENHAAHAKNKKIRKKLKF